MQASEKPFDEPWQAEAFALTVALNESGHLPWDEWASAFSSTLAAQAADQAGAMPDLLQQSLPDSAEANAAYWRAWLQTLEQLLRTRGIAAPLQLTAHREAVRAYNRIAVGTAMFRMGDQVDPAA